jgi:hypothetical protein
MIQISKLFQANQLILNTEKTRLVKFALTKSSWYPLNLSYAGYILTEWNNINFCILQLDSQLNGIYITYYMSWVSFVL